MPPILALIGRHNVGKSTLFNRLTRTNDALVVDFPGLTRDRKYGRAKVGGYEFICVDTGGIDELKNGVKTRVVEQSMMAIEGADIILFLVDARTGVMPGDFTVANHVRSCEKITFLVANKTDGIDSDQAITEFWSLGFSKIYPISASHGRGVSSLLESIFLPFINKPNLLEEKDKKPSYCMKFEVNKKRKDRELKKSRKQQDLPIKLAVVGRPNVGKSTLINRILGEERVVVYEVPGTTRDSIYIPMHHANREYMLIDTAGVRKRCKVTNVIEKFSVIKTLQAIEDANVVLLVIDAREGLSNQDLSLLDFILNSGRSLVIVINKWDGLSNKTKKQIKKGLNYRLDFIDFVRVHFISALYGDGVDALFKSVREAYESSTYRQSTSVLTRIMKMATKNHQPPLVHGRHIKLKYAHPGGYNPPIVVIHGNQVKDLPDSYKRYLINYFRKSLDIMGTPIRILCKEGKNPFI